ncbi:CYTH domain-containing protein [Ferruginibacter sp. SUN106]|uniref:CYTH domain-containing protein n=1 Tax=Ferruginibacter sp. SUN106 TaxID=2978348 RepID=UPI003D3624AF
MAQEIERKYLVDHTKWGKLEKPAGDVYRQGYLLTDPQKTIRIRLTANHAYLTIKGLSVGATRPEYEYEIPQEDAKELLDKFAVTELSKTRYKIIHRHKTWEVDEFAGSNAGLIVAEIELTSEDGSFDIPEWVTGEVTGDEKYYNSNLTIRPYKNWDM